MALHVTNKLVSTTKVFIEEWIERNQENDPQMCIITVEKLHLTAINYDSNDHSYDSYDRLLCVFLHNR